MDPIIAQIAKELEKHPKHVENGVRLLDEGITIPFIARYRKELHGAMTTRPCGPWRSVWAI
ncbi:MAG: Tex-like N-terminal domain-containing protein, partial [Oscillospiraceae bacterium]|nr:Tex-like N-terminal domain-containing protein [Oscillospiraceae bacterium]